MRRMKRPLTVAAACAAALTLFALPAAAGNDHNVNGTITSVTAQTISVQARNGVVTTCSLGLHSPAVAGFAPGDHVRMVCHGAGKRMARLAKIRRLDPATAPTAASADTKPVTFGGAITALSDTSISLHDGDRDLTCTIGDGSPSTGDYKVGQHVKVACAGGALVSISALGSGDVGRYFTGTVASLDDTGITVNTEHGPVTCSIGDGSPSTAGVNVGDHVGIGCRASTMQLVLIRELGGGDGSTSGSGSTAGGDGSTSGGDSSGSTGDNSGSGSDSGSSDGGGDTSTTSDSSPSN
jgi:hypothetical protein